MRYLIYVLALMPLATYATPVVYNMTLEIDTVHTSASSPVYQSGNRYHGHFAVDDAVLAQDGLNRIGSLTAFVMTIEDYVWDINDPTSEFDGFRGPDSCFSGSPPLAACLGANAPGFDVANGEIVNLRGGVHGRQDTPFIDMSFGSPRATWTSLGSHRPNASYGRFSGFLTVSRAAAPVPEPSSLLAGLCLALLMAIKHRVRARRAPVLV